MTKKQLKGRGVEVALKESLLSKNKPISNNIKLGWLTQGAMKIFTFSSKD